MIVMEYVLTLMESNSMGYHKQWINVMIDTSLGAML